MIKMKVDLDKQVMGSQMQCGVNFLCCWCYCYVLWWCWVFGDDYVLLVGLNFFIVDYCCDDFIICCCIGFVCDWGYFGLCVVNLFVFCVIYLCDLFVVDDLVGLCNDVWLCCFVCDVVLVVVGWGNYGCNGDCVEYVCCQLFVLYCLCLNGFGEFVYLFYLLKMLILFFMFVFMDEF